MVNVKSEKDMKNTHNILNYICIILCVIGLENCCRAKVSVNVRLNDKNRMKREFYVRFREHLKVKCLGVTRTDYWLNKV